MGRPAPVSASRKRLKVLSLVAAGGLVVGILSTSATSAGAATCRAKDGANVMNARSVKTPDGETLPAGSSDTSAAPAPADPSSHGR